MLQALHSFFTLILAAVVLFSSATFTINKHYCVKRLVKTTVIKHNKGCETEADQPEQQSCCLEKTQCCSVEQLVFEGLDYLQFEKYVSEFDYEYFKTLPLINHLDLSYNQDLTYKPQPYIHYQPPPLIKPIYHVDEVYLI